MSVKSPPSTEAASRVWAAMQALVFSQDRRNAVRDALGLGFGRVKVLRTLTRGSLTLCELADAHGIDAPYATVIVDDLEARGLVLRSPHPDDRRRKLVSLTPAGAAAAARAEEILATPPAELTALSPVDLCSLDGLLARLGQPGAAPA
jgi:DNA-binding MarR family transcriptional regulator